MKKIQILIALLLLSTLSGCYWHDRGYRGGHGGYEGHGNRGHHDRGRD